MWSGQTTIEAPALMRAARSRRADRLIIASALRRDSREQ